MATGKHVAPKHSKTEQSEHQATSTYLDRTHLSDDPYARATYYTHSKKKHYGVRIFLIVVLIGLLGLGAAGISLYADTKALKADAVAIKTDAKTLADGLKKGKTQQIAPASDDIVNRTAHMKQIVDGPLWQVACYIPVYGEDVKTARQGVQIADELATQVISPVSNKLQGTSLSALISPNKSINIEMLQTIINTMGTTQPAIAKISQEVNALPQTHFAKANELLSKAKNTMTVANESLLMANKIAPMLPQLLGANGQTRTYIILAQNNAELRTTGGLIGAQGVMKIKDGQIQIGEFQGTADLFNPLTRTNHLAITDEEDRIFSYRLGATPADMNFTPNFVRTAELTSQLWRKQKGLVVDGVISVDPVFLQGMLSLVGDVKVNNITLNKNNAAKTLLHDVYLNYGKNSSNINEETNAFFAKTAQLTMQKVFSDIGKVDMQNLVSVFANAARDGHLYVWFNNPQEEQLIQDFDISGNIDTILSNNRLGVFFNDDTYSKISWYLSTKTTIDSVKKNADGTSTYKVSTYVKNNMTQSEAESLPKYVYGGNKYKRNKSDMLLRTYLMAPTGATISNVATKGTVIIDTIYAKNAEQTDSKDNLNHATLYGHDIWFGELALSAGEQATITYEVTTSSQATQPLTIKQTPTLQEFAGWKM